MLDRWERPLQQIYVDVKAGDLGEHPTISKRGFLALIPGLDS